MTPITEPPERPSSRYDEMTLGRALEVYFAENGFGKDGGYEDAWVDFKLGPIPMPFPNSAGRKRAVRFHDLHHALTGYATDTIGEFEISAGEIGSGWRRHPAGRQATPPRLPGPRAGAAPPSRPARPS